MSKIYDLMFKDIKLGEIHDTKEGLLYQCTNKQVKSNLLPYLLYKQRTISYEPTKNNVLEFIEDRVFPPNRQCAEEHLKDLGLFMYDAWEICKRTKGMTYSDYWWIASKGDEYKKIHCRYLIENGKGDQVINVFKV